MRNVQPGKIAFFCCLGVTAIAVIAAIALRSSDAQERTEKVMAFKGKLEPAHNRYYRGAPAVGSPLTAIHVKVGDAVRKGQKLLSLVEEASDHERHRWSHEAATANVLSFQIELKNMDAIVARNTKAGASVSVEDRDRAQRTLERIRADTDRAQAQVKEAAEQWRIAKVLQGYYAITSPIDGTVISLPAKLGSVESYPDSKTTWIEVLDSSVLEVRCDAPENIVDTLAPGRKAWVQQGGDRWPATVVHVPVAADPETGRISVRVEVSQKKEGRRLRCWTEVAVIFP